MRKVAAVAPPGAVPLVDQRFTSMQAARISGVPFFTVDYWDRSHFLRPTLASGKGRGRGRQRMYSYQDVLRLRIARELRDERVSLETLRRVVAKLGENSSKLIDATYVLVRNDLNFAQTPEELAELVRRSGTRTFGILLDLGQAIRTVAERATRVTSTAQQRF